jgi:predicted phage terminase large subunit-like protein
MIPAKLTDAEWAALTEQERDQLSADLEDIAGGESLPDFMRRMAPHHPPPRHLDSLIEIVEESRANRLLKVAISMPPGHAKTTLFLNVFAWWLVKFPGDTCAYNSYNSPQAYSKSVTARALAARAGVELSDDTNNKAEWRTTAGGGLLAGGMASLTGKRVQGPLVVDDPYSGPLDAYSPAYRESVWNDLMTVAMTRREGAPIFLVHTRWHEDDAIGRLKRLSKAGKVEDWRFINLPALDDAGGALWPEMYPASALLSTKADIGEYNFASLYQGEPRPRGGVLFGEPRYYDPETTSFEGCSFVLAADPAASEKTSADYSAAVVLSVKGTGPEAIGYVRRVYRQQVAIPKLVADLQSLQQSFGNATINVESAGGFKAVPQMLRALGLQRVREIVPIGDKFTRAQPVAAAWNAGRILVPADSPPWLGPFLDELSKFTGVNDAYDDQTDALAHAWNSVGKAVTYRAPPAGAPKRRQ